MLIAKTKHDNYLLLCYYKECNNKIKISEEKYVFENNLEGLKRPYEYEYGKVNWNQNILDDYRKRYFWNYCQNEPARKYASEVIEN